MVDLFQMYVATGGCTSRYDWLNHVIGARELMGQANTPFQLLTEVAASVSHPDSFHYGLQLYTDDDEEYMAYDECEPGTTLYLTRRDVELLALPPMRFCKWLLRLLGLPARIPISLLCHDKLFHFQVGGAGFYVSAAASMQQLQEHLAEMNNGSPAMCIALDDTLMGYECGARLLGEAPRVAYRSIKDFVSFKQGEYVYTYPLPLQDLIEELIPSLPDAEFLPRPEGCGWNNLHIQIATSGHFEFLNVTRDMLMAWYEDDSGEIIGKRKVRNVSSWGFLCRNNKATSAYTMLKLFAAHKGRLANDQTDTIKNANVVRTKLRQFLCRMFGYTKGESPIEEESSKKPRIFRTEFSISFTDAKSDPLAEKRGRARVELKD